MYFPACPALNTHGRPVGACPEVRYDCALGCRRSLMGRQLPTGPP